MDVVAEPMSSVPLLMVQRAAHRLRLGGAVRIAGRAQPIDVVAAEQVMHHRDFLAALPRGSLLALTGHRLASFGIPATPDGVYLLPLSRSDADSGRVAMFVDPTMPAGEAAQLLAIAAPTFRPEVIAAVELCKLCGLLPAAIVQPASDGDALPVTVEAVTGYRRLAASTLRPVSEARVPLADADLVRIVSFRPTDGGPEQLAILVGEPERHAAPLARLHSECFTGDFLGSLRCDCGDQLRGAIRRMAHEGGGVLLYLAQEGRGIGLTNKLRAYILQDTGLDTIEANHHLGFGSDERDFWAAAAMLRQVGIGRVRLLTNNPAKITQLEQHGIEVAGRVPHIFDANVHNRRYLLTKAVRSGHLLAVDDLQPAKSGAA